MPQKPRSEDTSYPEFNLPDDKQILKIEAKAGDNSNAGAAGDFTARDSSTVNIGSTINNILSKKDCQFFRLKDTDLKNFDSPYFPILLQIDDLLNKLTTNQILLLGGTHEDKQEIAVHLAVKLKRYIESKSSVPNGISILKWNSVSDYRGILAEIRGEEEDDRTEKSIRIILLPDLKPDYIGFDIDRIKQAIPNSHCYVIADTDKPLPDWTMAPQQQQNCWWDTANVSYEPNSLAEAAVQRLAEAKINLDTTVESYLRQQIIQLNTVAKVKDFIQWLRNEEQLGNQDAADHKQPLSQNAVDKALSQAQQDRSTTLDRWFRQLTPRRQLVVIGVTLFKNLFSNQFFVGLERVVEQTWRKRESSLRSLDYSDIELLGNYCEFVSGSYQDSSRLFTHIDTEQQSTEFEVSQLKLRRHDEARVLFLVAWKTHQRHIISALKEMAQMVEDSVGLVYQNSIEWELFSDEFQSQQLRDVVGQTLSEIGLISLSATNAVQNILLSLAANDSIEVRDVAAKAIASWYPDNPKQFYETLQRLYSVAVGKYLNSPNLANSIGATVAMTISYATLSDSPNNLSEKLRNWLNELSESKSFAVRAHLGYHTLAFVIPRHFQQLKVFLKTLTEKYGGLEEDNGLANAIGWSLAQAYKEYPTEVMDLIEELFQNWKRIIPKLITKTESIEANKLRDYKANVIAITLSEIQISDRASSQHIFNYLLELLKGKKKRTREIAIQALCKQIKENFSVISDAIQECATKLRKNERTLVAESLTTIYLQQRKALSMPERGDTWYTQNGDIYRIWIKNDRPLTAIEETLFSWLGNEKLPVAQQLATQAFINFAKEFDLNEASFVKEFLSQDNLSTFDQTSEENFLPDHSATVLSGLWAWLAIFPTALPEMLKNRIWQPDIIKQYQPVVSNILPQAVIQTMDNNEAVEFVVNKWRKSKTPKLLGQSNDAPELTVMAKFLIPSLWLAKNPGVVFLIFFLGISVVAWIGHSSLGIIIDSINQNIDRPTSISPEQNSSTVSSPTPSPSTYKFSTNQFDSDQFPKTACGDSKPTNPLDYPVSFYPVFIDNTDANLNRIRAEFCQDARPAFREKMNKTSILVASFTSTQRAEEFRAFLASRFGNAEIGEPTVVPTP